MNRVPATLAEMGSSCSAPAPPGRRRAAVRAVVALVRPEALLVTPTPVPDGGHPDLLRRLHRVLVALPDGVEVRVDVPARQRGPHPRDGGAP